ncbi:MAG: hypothetical protein JNK45_32370 [Myxococcales bacterium]|nr:hypothetical protein [Myxococcales bacterium]
MLALLVALDTVLRRHHVPDAVMLRIHARLRDVLAGGSPDAEALLLARSTAYATMLEQDGEMALFTALVPVFAATLGLTEDDARCVVEPMFSLMIAVDRHGVTTDRLVTRELADELADASRIRYAEPRWSGYDVLARHVDPIVDTFALPSAPVVLRRAALDPTLDVATQQRLVAESFGLEDALDPPAPGAAVSVCTQARPGRFTLVRHASPEATHSGWVVGCGDLEHAHDRGSTRLEAIEAVVEGRPALARFLALPVGVIVAFDRHLIVEDTGGLLVALPGSSIDALAHRGETELAATLRAALRERIAAGQRDSAAGAVGEAYLVRPLVVERLLAALDAEHTAAELDGVPPDVLREAGEIAATRGKVAAALWLRDRVGGLAAAKRIVEALEAASLRR